MATGDSDTSMGDLLRPIPHARRIWTISLVLLAAIGSYLHVSGRIGLPLDVIGFSVALLGGWSIWRETWQALREWRVNMEMTMAVGVAAALIVGQIATGALIVAFALVSEYLEELTRSRGKRAVEVLIRAAPEFAHRAEGSGHVSIPVASLRPGDEVRVFPGEKVPADGVVRAGRSHVDESAITGEPYAKDKTPGSHLFAGTLNGSGTLDVRVERSGEDSTFGRILTLVREADLRRGPSQRLADRVAKWILLVSIAAAALALAVTRDATIALSVVLVAGACGVAAGTPLAILATTAKGAARGIVYKGGEGVEALARADTFVFDKTGTLTRGEPAVIEIIGFEQDPAADFYPFLAAIERGSDHPIAAAIERRAGPQRRVADAVEEMEGRGIRGIVEGHPVLAGNLSLLAAEGVPIGDTAREHKSQADERGDLSVFVAVDGELRGVVTLRDELRPDAAPAIRELRAARAHVSMLTGDQAGPAYVAARDLGIDDHHAELLPEGKIRVVEAMRARPAVVCFVGDGINDAPALAAADVGVAVRHGSDVALESADVILMADDLGRLVEAWRSARRARRVIYFNLVATLSIDIIGMALAAGGFLGPVAAASVHLGSELMLIANSARLFA